MSDKNNQSIGFVPRPYRGHVLLATIAELFKPIHAFLKQEHVYSVSFSDPETKTIVRIIRDSSEVWGLESLDTGSNHLSSVVVDANAPDPGGEQIVLPMPMISGPVPVPEPVSGPVPVPAIPVPAPPINWDAVTLHTPEVRHYYIPSTQSTGLICEVCDQSELSSIHINRKEYQR